MGDKHYLAIVYNKNEFGFRDAASIGLARRARDKDVDAEALIAEAAEMAKMAVSDYKALFDPEVKVFDCDSLPFAHGPLSIAKTPVIIRK